MKIRKLFKVFFVSAVLALCIAAPSFAATTKEEYRTEAAAIRSERLGLEAQIDTLQSENSQISARLAEARKVKLDTKASPIDAETWKQIDTLLK